MTEVNTLLAGIKAHYECVAYADDVPEGGNEEVPEDYERHYCNEDGEDWPCPTARTDVPRLIQALEAVAGLHRETMQEFITASACIREECECENECPVEPLPVCHHCWGQLEQIDPYFGEDHHVSEVMWPCPTITAVVAALGEDR